MTDIEIRDPGGDVAQQPQQPRPGTTVARLAEWAGEARAAASVAVSLCKTSFVPRHFQGKPEEATAAILTGHEMGLSPMASLRSIYVISGTPAMYAHAMRAVVQSHGHRIWVEHADLTRVVVCGQRKGTDEVQRSEWTADRAKRAGLQSNPNYAKHPQAMLTARATAEVCRLIAADALHGIPYAVEEFDEQPAWTEQRPAPARVTAAEILGAPAPAGPVEQPAADPAPPAEEPVPDWADVDWPEPADIPGGDR